MESQEFGLWVQNSSFNNSEDMISYAKQNFKMKDLRNQTGKEICFCSLERSVYKEMGWVLLTEERQKKQVDREGQ
jgi:hypothetical protein